MGNKQSWIQFLFGRKSAKQASMPSFAPQTLPEATPPFSQQNAVREPSAPLASVVSQQVAPSGSSPVDAAAAVVWREGDVILDQYEVRGILGEGGMGTVYHVYHRAWNTDLAVKTPKPEMFTRTGGKENFIREAETWINLGLHPHIVSCYYVRILGGNPCIFAEYVQGGSLADWIHKRKLYEGGHKQSLERILDVAIQVAWGLQYAHQQGLIHQDVKPANVMMTADGTARVTDFGLAKAQAMAGEVNEPEGDKGKSILVSSRGMTPAYCSPEQAAGQTLSRRTDIWSWGVSVLEMFVGSVTWMSGVIAREALASYEVQDPAIPIMPAEVVKLLTRCFLPRPEERPATMLEIATVLREIYERELGHPYPRQVPKEASALSDSLNNRALSLYDLGKREEAMLVWQQALQANPYHPEATYNRGIALWRQAELTDDALVKQLERMRTVQSDRWQPGYLLALVHLERGDGDIAQSLLREAARQAPEETDVQLLLEHVLSGTYSAGRCLQTITGYTKGVSSISVSADGRLFLSGGDDNSMRIWEIASGRCLHTFTGHTEPVSAVSLSADGHLALSGSRDKTLRLWEVESGRCLRTFIGHTHWVSSVNLSADGCLALSGSMDNSVRCWEIASGRCLRTFTGHTYSISSVSLSADGRFALSGSGDKTLRLWEVSSGRCLRTFTGHTDWVGSVCLSADGRLALSGSSDNSMRLWEISSGRCLRTFTGHTEPVTSVSWSTDGRFAFSGSQDKTLRLWEVSSGRCLHIFGMHTKLATSLRLSADGRFVLSGVTLPSFSGNDDYMAWLWELDWELEARDLTEWDDGAQSYLDLFLIQHTPYAGVLPQNREPSEREIEQALTRCGRPSWNEEDFQKLIQQLHYAGFGWLRSEGVRKQLEQLAGKWEGPPRLEPLTPEDRSGITEDKSKVILDRTETIAPRSSFTLSLPQTMYQEMITHVMNDYPTMACGMLGSVDGRVIKHYPVTNVAHNPKEFFMVSIDDTQNIFVDVMDYDGDLVVYVSYPIHDAYPSKSIIENAQRSGYPHILISLKQYPEHPSCRVFTVDRRGKVTEGAFKLI